MYLNEQKLDAGNDLYMAFLLSSEAALSGTESTKQLQVQVTILNGTILHCAFGIYHTELEALFPHNYQVLQTMIESQISCPACLVHGVSE